MKKIKKIFEKYSVFILFIAPLLMGPFLIENNNNIIFTLFFFVALLIIMIVFYYNLKSKYENLGKFLFLIGLITTVFPIIHLAFFNLGEDNYTYDNDFLSYQKEVINYKLKSFQDYEILEEILNTNKAILIDESILYRAKDTVVEVSTYLVKTLNIEESNYQGHGGGGIPRANDQKSQIIIYSKINNQKLTSVDFYGINIKTSIEEKLLKRKELIEFKEHPISYITYRDIWIDSFTGFILSNIKPVSFLPQIIQIFQVFIFFIIGSILGGFISNSKSFMLEKKKKKKKN